MNVFQHTKDLQKKQPIADSARTGQTETRVTLRRQETEMSGLSAGPLYTLLKISSNRRAGPFSWIHQSQRQEAGLISARLCDWLKVISFAPAQPVRAWLDALWGTSRYHEGVGRLQGLNRGSWQTERSALHEFSVCKYRVISTDGLADSEQSDGCTALLLHEEDASLWHFIFDTSRHLYLFVIYCLILGIAMDVLPMCSIFQELQIVHDTGYFSALPSLEEYWQQVTLFKVMENTSAVIGARSACGSSGSGELWSRVTF